MTALLRSHAVGPVGFALAVLATVHMLAQRRTPRSASAWIVVMFVFSWLGVPLYLALGGRKMRELMDAKRELALVSHTSPGAPLDGIDTTLRTLDIPPAETGHAFRLHADAVGSLPLGSEFLAPLRDIGGEIARFMPVLHRPFRGRFLAQAYDAIRTRVGSQTAHSRHVSR